MSQSLTDGYYQQNDIDVDLIYAYIPQFSTAHNSIQSVTPIVLLLRELLGTCEELVRKNFQMEIQLKQDENFDKIQRQKYNDLQNQPYGSEWESNNGKSRWGSSRGYLQSKYK